MQQLEDRFIYAASDLNNFLECTYLTELDRLVARGEKTAPVRDDAQVELIARKGDEHEKRYLGQLTATYARVTQFDRPEHSVAGIQAAQAQTIAAMERGDALIYQATFFDGQFLGHPDFLRRVEVPCERWAWSYEVIDTKLALNAKPYFIIQLCNYSEHLARVQGGTMPEYGYIVLGNGDEQRFRLNDYAAYYRRLKARFLTYVSENTDADAYPHKCSHCAPCKWADNCKAQRVSDDHLSLVAWMRRDQIGKLNAVGIDTVVDLGAARDGQRPQGMSVETFGKLRRQAQMQVRGRSEGPVYELLEHDPLMGFGLMPEPAEGDVFFDMEGDPLYEPSRGLEYLFGCWLPPCHGEVSNHPEPVEGTFKAFWALTRTEEKRAFEQFIDFIVERRKQYPNLHVYHYADYERAALRRLAQAHGTREQEVDDLLRGEVLVDLYAVVRQALVISEESYSIKRLEKFYPLKRVTEVKKGDDSIVMFEQWLQDQSRRDILDDIERYNEDDCRSTLLLRDWLLERRTDAMAKFGNDIPFRPRRFADEPCHPEPVDNCRRCMQRAKTEREDRHTTDLQRRLLDGVLAPQSETEYALMSDDHRARYLLANLLAYHRREDKPVWWAFFDRCENQDTLLEFDKDAIAGLQFCADVEVGKEKKSSLYTYAFPEQHYKVGVGDAVTDPATGKGVGSIFALDDDNNRLTLKWTGTLEQAQQIRALIPGGPIDSAQQRAALVRIAESYLAGTLSGATLDLLLSRDPRVRVTVSPSSDSVIVSPSNDSVIMSPSNDRVIVSPSNDSVIVSPSNDREPVERPPHPKLQPDTVTPQAVSAVAQALDNSYLFIQGPPGTGKSTTGSQVICDLLAAGKRVGVLSRSHKAIHHLLHKVESCAHERGFTFNGLYKYTKDNAESQYVSPLAAPCITAEHSNEPFEDATYELAAGTPWLFARPALVGAFDYLFIDEAGQLSLADALAVSAAAHNVVLLGDPLQLAQVSQGTHPLRAGASVLEHLLGDAQTVPEHRGIFLDVSYRMHPEICEFISEAMYEGRLHAAPQTTNQRIDSAELTGAGLRFISVSHEGNSRESIEEANTIVDAVRALLQGTVTEANGTTRAMTPSDIIIVTPYNAQRKLVTKALNAAGFDIRVGTVDKFQGQEAYVVFYTMATSGGDELPRDIGFLFEPNRFNVAVSRARALSTLACNVRLLDIPCKQIEQIATVNVLCAFAEATLEKIAREALR